MDKYIGSQQHWEDCINANYDERERQQSGQKSGQVDNRTQPDPRINAYDFIQQLRGKAKNCEVGTKEDRARKGAYVDCIIMATEAMDRGYTCMYCEKNIAKDEQIILCKECVE